MKKVNGLGKGALHIACEKNLFECAKLLLDECCIIDKDG